MKAMVCIMLAVLMIVSGCSSSLHDSRKVVSDSDTDAPPQEKKDIPIVTGVTDFTAEFYWDVEDAFWDVASVAGSVAYVVGLALVSDPCIEAGYQPHAGYGYREHYGFSYGCGN